MPDYNTMVRTVEVTSCGRYRLKLSRTWDTALPRLMWIVLHAGGADAQRCDPVVMSCVGFSDRAGYGGLTVSALYAIRRDQPVDLWGGPHPLERGAMLEQACTCAAVVYAWSTGLASGSGPDLIAREGPRVTELFARVLPHLPTYCLGYCSQGDPLSPTYLPATTQLRRFHDGHTS